MEAQGTAEVLAVEGIIQGEYGTRGPDPKKHQSLKESRVTQCPRKREEVENILCLELVSWTYVTNQKGKVRKII